MIEWLFEKTPIENWILISIVIICLGIYMYCVAYITKSLKAKWKSRSQSLPDIITRNHRKDSGYHQNYCHPRATNAKTIQYQSGENDNGKPNKNSNNFSSTHFKRILWFAFLIAFSLIMIFVIAIITSIFVNPQLAIRIVNAFEIPCYILLPIMALSGLGLLFLDERYQTKKYYQHTKTTKCPVKPTTENQLVREGILIYDVGTSGEKNDSQCQASKNTNYSYPFRHFTFSNLKRIIGGRKDKCQPPPRRTFSAR